MCEAAGKRGRVFGLAGKCEASGVECDRELVVVPAQHDILAAVVRTVAEEGRTVVFSSHLLDEVERVVDHVVMLHEGRVAVDLSMDDIKARYRKYVIRWREDRIFL